MMRTIVSTALFLASINILSAQEKEIRTFASTYVPGAEVSVDGRLDEAFWGKLQWQDAFTQLQPYEGKPASQPSAFAVGHDDDFLYVGFRLSDAYPDSIVQRLSRRDEVDGDLAIVWLDSYHDRRTAFAFAVSAAGVKFDFVISNDGDREDPSWNPIWWTRTSKDAQGWYAEMKIPFTQLRFEQKRAGDWGLQAGRFLFRNEEITLWQPASRKTSGWVSQFGLLEGIQNIEAKKPAELVPYVLARTDRFEKEPDNPFKNKGFSNNLDVGLDGKLGLTNNLTLDFSINPDFGQVEADPSQVNLTTVETFFTERRPFFVEGKNILSFPLFLGDGDLSAQNLFYSRRVGRKVSLYPNALDGEYVDMPDFTRILGAAKLSGKTRNGWSVGILESVTAQEKAELRFADGRRRTETVEPLANYFVGRVQKDFNEGNTYLGGMLTSVKRDLDEIAASYLHRSALSGGIDFVHKWDNRNWEFDLSAYFSRVDGTQEAVTHTQESYVHLFQRPDRGISLLDTSRTRLAGSGGKAVLAKMGGNLRFMGALTWQSPSLEINDVGYGPETDNILQIFWVGYRIFEPFSIFRSVSLNANQWTGWTFAREYMGLGGNLNGHVQFKNNWQFSTSLNYSGAGLYTAALRGGPALRTPPGLNTFVFLSTNDQKKFKLGATYAHSGSSQKDYRQRQSFSLDLSYRPSNTLKVSLGSSYMKSQAALQYVTGMEWQGQTRYVMGAIDQTVLSFSLRLNYNITPDLTIQYWGQPFVAAGNYSDFKYITDSKAADYRDCYHAYTAEEIRFSGETYLVDENGDRGVDYHFGKPDFNVKEFLSNLVVRWEYLPGSTVFLVWSQNRNSFVDQGLFQFGPDLQTLFEVKPYDVLLLKWSYRFGR